MRKIVLTMVAVTAVIVLVLLMTKIGRDIDAATQRFMLFYAGVFALIGLTGSVVAGLLATDRIVMTPGHRVMAQAVHRAMSFGALAFLIIHIVTEILAQRAHVIDAVIPFLSPYRTFYIGLGTIASDLIIAIVVTSILRRRFTGHGAAWRWRAIHYSAYAAFVFGVLHGLLGGRAAKPYVDWSYGFAIALVAMGLAVRFLAISLRPKESVSPRPGERSRADRGSPLHAAAMSLAQSQLGGNPVQVLPPALAARAAAMGGPDTGAWSALPPVQAWSAASGPQPALVSPPSAYTAHEDPAYFYDPAPMPLGAPYGDAAPAGFGARPYVPAEPAAVLPAAAGGARQPMYEPGYDGPPRFEGAPRGHGDVPRDELSSYPYGPAGAPLRTSALPPAGFEGSTAPRRSIGGPANPGIGNPGTGPMPRPGSGPIPRLATGPIPQAGPRPGPGPDPRAHPSGPLPRLGLPGGRALQRNSDTGSFPRADSGPLPRLNSGPLPRADSGPLPRADSGPLPWAGSGPYPRMGSGPVPTVGSGPYPWAGSGPLPRAGTGPLPQIGSGPVPRADLSRADSGPLPRADGSGPLPQLGSGPYPRPDSGPAPRNGTGPIPRSGHGPVPGAGTGSFPRVASGPMPTAGSGPMPQSGSGAWPRPDAGPAPRPDTGPIPRVRTDAWGAERAPDPLSEPDPVPVPVPWSDLDSSPRHARRPASRPDAASVARHDTGSFPRMGYGPRTGPLPRATRQANPDESWYREAPGRNGGNEWQ